MKHSHLLAALLAASLTSAPVLAQVIVSPLVVESFPSSVTVANTGSEPIRIAVEPLDFDQDGAGRTTFTPVGTSAHSCSGRLRIGDAPTQVPAKGEVRIAVAVDRSDRPCWGAVVIRISTGFAAAGRIAVKVYSVPAGARRSAEVASIRVAADTVHTEIENTGPTPLRPRGRIEIRTLQGATIATQEVDAFGVHPGIRRSFAVPLRTRIPPGSYVVLCVFDIGAPDLIAGETRIEIPGGAAGPE